MIFAKHKKTILFTLEFTRHITANYVLTLYVNQQLGITITMNASLELRVRNVLPMKAKEYIAKLMKNI